MELNFLSARSGRERTDVERTSWSYPEYRRKSSVVSDRIVVAMYLLKVCLLDHARMYTDQSSLSWDIPQETNVFMCEKFSI